MADDTSMSLREAVGKVMSGEHADVLRESVALVVREVMEAEVAARAGTGRYERPPSGSLSATATGPWPQSRLWAGSSLSR